MGRMSNDTTLPTQTLFRPFLFILDEFAGHPPKTTPGSACLDRDTGWQQTLAAIDADQASRPIVDGGTSIAAQTAHAAYYVELIEAGMRGAEPVADWPGSFQPAVVDEASWHALRGRLQTSLERFRALVTSDLAWNESQLGDALGVLAHTAYHLGSVRQMVRATGARMAKAP
jgi:hypothetical protein